MAMARMIGMKITVLMYPMIRPARAIPPPIRRPPLLRILDWATCPRMMAGIPARRLKQVSERMPRMRLTTALPSVCGCGAYGWPKAGYCQACAGAGAAAGAGVGRGGAALTRVPHSGHASDVSGMDVPHLKQ